MTNKKSQRINSLRTGDIVLNSIHSCITNTPKKFPRTPEVSFSEPFSQPRMFSHQLERAVAFKQLQCSRNAHCWRQLNKQMHMIFSNMQFIDSAFVPFSSFSDKSFTINFHEFKFKWVPSILGLPHKMEGVLPEGMTKTCKIHFFAPCLDDENRAHAKRYLIQEGSIYPLNIQEFTTLNYLGDGDSSFGLKAEVSSPCM